MSKFEEYLEAVRSVIESEGKRKETNIMKLKWKETESNIKTWHEAKELEKDGWRLPTVPELQEAMNIQLKERTEGFFLNQHYWSSRTNGSKAAYIVHFPDVQSASQYKKSYSFVRLCKNI
jgi:hypothetical protein